ncbi:NAD(P)/FAD-dependent oxidoreductase [Nocardioides sp. YJ-D4]
MPVGRIVIVGAGHAGGTFAGMLRQAGYGGEVVLFGAEPHPPYQRPPLSKQFLGDAGAQWLRDPDFYAEQDVRLVTGTSIVDVDPTLRVVRSADGTVTAYDWLVLATGAAPRTLPVPGAALDGVLSLRTLDDARQLRTAITPGADLAIVGGGYVGLEVAAVARGAGMAVTIIEKEDRLLARVASPELSAILAGHHERRGTTVLTGAQVAAFDGENNRLTGLYLGDGSHLAATVAVVGVGAVPRDELAEHAGLLRAPSGGVLVDESGRTSNPAILAIGDVSVRPHPLLEAPRRFESIPSATEQARQAVSTVLGTPAPESEMPWFWSDQFDLKLKIAGVLEAPYETVTRGDPDGGSFALFHHRDGRLVAVEAANANADFMAARRLLARRQPIDPVRLGDSDVPLRELIPA